MPFGRPGPTKPAPKPASITYTGDNAPEVADWARDDDLSPRFAPPHLGQPARARIPLEPGQGDTWAVVEPGDTLHTTDDGTLRLEQPARPAPESKEDQE